MIASHRWLDRRYQLVLHWKIGNHLVPQRWLRRSHRVPIHNGDKIFWAFARERAHYLPIWYGEMVGLFCFGLENGRSCQ